MHRKEVDLSEELNTMSVDSDSEVSEAPDSGHEHSEADEVVEVGSPPPKPPKPIDTIPGVASNLIVNFSAALYGYTICMTPMIASNSLMSISEFPQPLRSFIETAAPFTIAIAMIPYFVHLRDNFGQDSRLGYTIKTVKFHQTILAWGPVVAASLIPVTVISLAYSNIREDVVFNHTSNGSIEAGIKFLLRHEPSRQVFLGTHAYMIGVITFKGFNHLSHHASDDEYTNWEIPPSLHALIAACHSILHAGTTVSLTETVIHFLNEFGSAAALRAANSPIFMFLLLFGSDAFLRSLTHLAYHPKPFESLFQSESAPVQLRERIMVDLDDEPDSSEEKACTVPAGVKTISFTTLLLLAGYTLTSLTCLIPALYNTTTVKEALLPPLGTHVENGPFCNQASDLSRVSLEIAAVAGTALLTGVVKGIYSGCKAFGGTLFGSCQPKTPADEGYAMIPSRLEKRK